MAEEAKKSLDNFVSVSDLLHMCAAKWRWFIASVLVCLLFAVYYLVRTPNLYTRSATIIVREQMQGNSASENGSEFEQLGFVNQKNNMHNVERHLMSLDVLMEVAHRLDSTLRGDKLIMRALDIQDGLSVEVDGILSNVIDLTYKDYSVDEAEKVLTLVLVAYNEKTLEYKRITAKNTSRFIDARLAVLERDLNIVDDSIAKYKSSYGITELEHVSDIYLRQQSESDAEIMRLSSQRQMAEYIRQLLEDDESHHQLLLSNSGINNGGIESQITLYNNMLLELQNHLNYTSEQNPLIIHQQKEIKNLRSKILTNIINYIHSIDIQLESLTDYYNEATSKVTSNPSQAKYLATVERERKVKESLYLFLLQKKEENDISITYQAEHAQVIDPPYGSYKPTSPQKSKVLMGAVFMGLLIPIAVIFLRVTLSETVSDHHDVERHPGIPFLAEVPMSERTSTILSLQRMVGLKHEGGGVVVSKDKKTPINEAFRLIRTKLEHATDPLGGMNGVYMVTSDQANAGKTFVSMNLAVVLALGGKRVLFVDADLRHATASQRWKAGGRGLTDFLEGREGNIEALLFHPKGQPMLDVLPAGPVPSAPTELLSSPLFGHIVERVRHLYDVVIIDTPPLGSLADTEIIGRHVDRSLFVIRAGLYHRSALGKLESPVENNNGKPQFVVLNGVNIDFHYDSMATNNLFNTHHIINQLKSCTRFIHPAT